LSLRVLHCPSSVGGHPQGLSRAERAIGLESRSVCFVHSPFGYRPDEVLAPEGTSPVRAELRRWKLLWRALRSVDVVHFNFGRTIMPSQDSLATVEQRTSPALARAYRAYASLLEYRDLPLLRRAGKTVAVTFQGDDARQGDYCAQHFEIGPIGEVEEGYYTAASDARKRKLIEAFDRNVDLIYALNPDLLRVLPARTRFVPYAHVDPAEWTPSPLDPSATRPPVVVHAPTHRPIKGTRFILDAVERLKAEGIPMEFVLVEGLSHDEVRDVFRRADLFIDQLLLGFYGGAAVELMALGKPVVCYLRDEDLVRMPEGMRKELPIIEATPSSIHSVLREWLTAPRSRLADRGRAGRRFVEHWHDPKTIARDVAADYAGARRPGAG
jgi:glycosyltransferase involved in cell wall biosynthesis